MQVIERRFFPSSLHQHRNMVGIVLYSWHYTISYYRVLLPLLCSVGFLFLCQQWCWFAQFI